MTQPRARIRALVNLASAVLLIAGCSGDDETIDPINLSAYDGGIADLGEPDTGEDGGSADMGTLRDMGPVVPTDVGLKIEFDFRFDRAGFFSSPEARGVLTEAARQWGVWLRDDFETIAAGTPIYTRDPEDPSMEPFIDIETDIDDILVFVGSAPRDDTLAGSSATAAFPAESDDPVLRAKLYERWESTENYEPWTAWMSFDDDRDWFFDPTPQTGDDVPAGRVDALSVTLHELGHILGVSPGEAFAAHVVDGTFQGPHAMEVYGGPVPLADGYGHIADDVTIDGKVPVMSTRKPSDVRYEITRLDLAILADIGYELP